MQIGGSRHRPWQNKLPFILVLLFCIVSGCRKPAPGLLLTAAAKYGVDLKRSFMVGDRWRDVDAGRRAGCRTIWIDPGYHEKKPAEPPDLRVSSLIEATDWILKLVTEDNC